MIWSNTRGSGCSSSMLIPTAMFCEPIYMYSWPRDLNVWWLSESDPDSLPIDFVLDKRLWMSWFPRLRFCGRCRNLELRFTIYSVQWVLSWEWPTWVRRDIFRSVGEEEHGDPFRTEDEQRFVVEYRLVVGVRGDVRSIGQDLRSDGCTLYETFHS